MNKQYTFCILLMCPFHQKSLSIKRKRAKLTKCPELKEDYLFPSDFYPLF